MNKSFTAPTEIFLEVETFGKMLEGVLRPFGPSRDGRHKVSVILRFATTVLLDSIV